MNEAMSDISHTTQHDNGEETESERLNRELWSNARIEDVRAEDLNDEIRTQSGRNIVVARKFSEMLERTLLRYQNRTIEAAQVINQIDSAAIRLCPSCGGGSTLSMGGGTRCC